MSASRRTVAIAAVLALLFVVLVAARGLIFRAAFSTAISIATGYHVTLGGETIGWSHAALFDVHVSKNGDPVLDAQRVDVDYALRDIFPGGAHRYGFASLAIQNPVLTITRHADGSLTFNRPGGTGAAPPPQTRKAAAPYFFTLRIRDGAVHLVDEAPLQADLANQTIENLNLDASVKTDARTTANLSGVLVGRRTQAAPVQHFPFSEHTIIDTHRGIGLNHIAAREFPLRGVLGFFIHSPSMRFDDGVLDDVDVNIFALQPHAGDAMTYQLGGSLTLRGGRIAVSAIAKPIRDLQAHLHIAGGAIATNDLRGSVSGMPLIGRGAFYDVFGNNAQLWLGTRGDGNLASLRSLFTFAKGVPLRGPLHVETLLASKLTDPLIRNAFTIPSISYDRYPFRNVSGVADVHSGSLVVHGVDAQFGNVTAVMGGRILFSAAKRDDIVFALDATGPGRELPYADAVAPDATIHATSLVMQPPETNGGWRARGTIGAQGATDGGLTFSVNEKGVGAFGPLIFTRRDGSSLAGGFELDRPISQSAGWLTVHRFQLSSLRAPSLPGVVIPTFPPIAGILEGTLAAGGTPSQFGIAGHVAVQRFMYQNLQLGNGSVNLDGTFADLRLGRVALDGPLGRFTGNAGFARGIFALDGMYDGSLEALQPFFGSGVNATGGVHGPVRATIASPARGSRQPSIVVQTTGVTMAHARIRGVPLDAVNGTLLVHGSALRIVAADASVQGAHAVMGDAGGPFLVSAPGIPAGALRSAGLPLQRGELALFGLADLTRGPPRFDGSLALSNGLAAGLPISGGASVHFDGKAATVSSGIAALGATYGGFAGRIDVASQAPTYDLNANVPLGDIADIRQALSLPMRTLDGSFTADVHVAGSGGQPRIAGDVVAPEGEYNGLAFRNAHALLEAGPGRVVARNGAITVGSTVAAVNASAGGGGFAVNLRSDNANLEDFDNYFNEAETLAGRGRVAVDLANDGHTTRTSGTIALQGLRFRGFAFGTTDATWSQRAGRVTAALNIFSPHGSLKADGTVVSAGGGLIRSLQEARLNVHAAASKVELGSWLPAFGFSAPILGQVDANANVNGAWPNLGVDIHAALQNGSLLGYNVRSGELHARGDAGRIALSNTSLDFGFARFDASGTFGLAATAPLALAVHGETPDIGRVLATVLPRQHYDVGGALQADARISGTRAKPRTTLGFNLTSARYQSLAIPAVLGSVAYDGKTLELLDAEATFAKGNIFLAGSLPLSLEPVRIRPHAPFSFTLAFGGLDLAPFAPFLPTNNTKLDGRVDGRIAIEGTADAPRVFGSLALANGYYASDFDRAPISGANATLAFSGTSVALEALHANVGGGSVDGRGRLDLPFPSAPARGYAVSIVAKGARFDLPQYATGQVDGALRLARVGTLPQLSGRVTLSNTSIPFGNILHQIGSAGGGGTASGTPFDLAFNLVATAGKNVRVTGSLIDVRATGSIALTGTLSNPRLGGAISAAPGGFFSTYNHVFRIQEAKVTFNPENGINPTINARAFAHVTNPDPDPTRNTIGSADITILVNGPADQLASSGNGIQFTSNPPYDRAQILGLLLDASLFGAVNFSQQQAGTLLRGAPPATNPLLPPGVTPYAVGALNLNEEAFSLLNGQLTQRFLYPVERLITGPLGLDDLELTVDYGGRVGYQAYKQIGHRDIYANFGQVLTSP
ncbi:MAG TPA: translocation/assembly module TamB domain-containing protein, partial [Candidatus Acidoferrum sp.]|nr:translocation/assembly module TamB domain-containing protein [Candidatus Acidoferrum sp.]